MDLSYIFLFSIPLIFSPAAFGLLFFRFIIPQAKLKSSTDYLNYLPFVIVTLLFNISLIFNFIHLNLSSYLYKNFPIMKYVILGGGDVFFKPTLILENLLPAIVNLFSNMCDCTTSLTFGLSDFFLTKTTYTLFQFIIDLQIRSIIFCFIIGVVIKSIFKIDDFYESYPYNNYKKNFLYYIGKYLLMYKLEKSEENFSYPNQNGYFSKIVESINILLTNEWVNSISYNEKIQLLIADIKTEDDHIYSGLLINIVSSKDKEFDAISINTPICYYPESKKNDENPNREIEKKGENLKNISKRKWRLIETNSELIFLNSRIISINLWHLLKGTKFKDHLYLGSNDYLIEKIKWQIKLMAYRQDLIVHYELNVYSEKPEELEKFEEILYNWILAKVPDLDTTKLVLNLNNTEEKNEK